jgi:uncharacterized membrane protein
MNDGIQVNVTCGQLRSWGRQALAGNWSLAVMGALLFSFLNYLPVLVINIVFNSDGLEWVINLYGILVSGPLTLGFTTFMIAVFRRRRTSPGEVFYGFESFGKSLGLFLATSFFILLWSLLVIIPGIIAAYRYAMSFYILADNPGFGVMETIRESKRIMYGNKLKLFTLELSFLGWAILALITAGIGFLWLLPYMVASTVGFYEVANGNLRIGQRERTIEHLQEER